MNVIPTDTWLRKSYDTPIELCKKLKSYFPAVSENEIHQYLAMHGMYYKPTKSNPIEKWLEKNVWDRLEMEANDLKKCWDGPDVPIFILPANQQNQEIQKRFNGKSGLAFRDKLFLFISDHNTVKEMKALLTHEYNHVCRLAKSPKKEKDYVLLDVIIMEGLAENAVLERHGKAYQASWTSFYSDKELQHMWERIILPSRMMSTHLRQHRDLLYGKSFLYPKMAGYCTGYYLVKRFVEKHDMSSRDMLKLSSTEIAQLTE